MKHRNLVQKDKAYREAALKEVEVESFARMLIMQQAGKSFINRRKK